MSSDPFWVVIKVTMGIVIYWEKFLCLGSSSWGRLSRDQNLIGSYPEHAGDFIN